MPLDRRADCSIRALQLPHDREQVLALDRSFTTDRIYRLAGTADSFRLIETVADPPLLKEFPLEDDLSEYESFVAETGGSIVGYAAYTHQAWNRRTEIWHLYVTPTERRLGVGRGLVLKIAERSRTAGMRCIWLETSNLAFPAIQFYRRMGFALCGLDITLYDPEGPSGSETALYFALSIDASTDSSDRN